MKNLIRLAAGLAVALVVSVMASGCQVKSDKCGPGGCPCKKRCPHCSAELAD